MAKPKVSSKALFPKWLNLFLLFTGAFLFLLFFGLCESKLWEVDELQTYLIGLKCYTTHTWPYFGPDVNGIESSFQSQLPGALEGILFFISFTLFPIPEGPFIMINLMTAFSAAVLAWYIQKRLPKLSFPLVYIWICLTPWVLHKNTYVITSPFFFLASILFFVGFMETLPEFSMKLVPARWCNAAMGFSLFFIMQFHFSYVYFLPLSAFSLLVQMRNSVVVRFFYKPSPLAGEGRVRGVGSSGKSPSPLDGEGESWKPIFYFILGALPMIALIVPTFVKYGMTRANVASGFAVPFYLYNFKEWLTILSRYLSLVCFELPRFIGHDTAERMDFLKSHPWLALPGLFLWVAGIAQVFVLLFCWFKKPHLLPDWKWLPNLIFVLVLAGLVFNNSLTHVQSLVGVVLMIAGRLYLARKPLAWFQKPSPLKGWKEIKLFILLVFLMIWVSFWFTIKGPVSHLYLVFYPWLMLYSCYCRSFFADSPRWRMGAKIFLALAFYFHVGHAIVRTPQDGIWTHRDSIVKALAEKNYHLMGERRPGSFY